MALKDTMTKMLSIKPELYLDRLMVLMEMDGKDHIRADNRAGTTLGRLLDSQFVSPFHIPGLGNFNTTEGLWYYISMQNPVEDLRLLSGNACRILIKELRNKRELKKIHRANFKDIILYGTWAKIENNPELKKLFTENTDLPYIRYYVTNKNLQNELFIDTNSTGIGVLNELRQAYQDDVYYKAPVPDVSEIVKGLSEEARFYNDLK